MGWKIGLKGGGVGLADGKRLGDGLKSSEGSGTGTYTLTLLLSVAFAPGRR